MTFECRLTSAVEKRGNNEFYGFQRNGGEQRASLRSSWRNYSLSSSALIAVIVFGGEHLDGKRPMMVFAILGVNLLLLLSSDSQMAQFQALRKDMPSELADSATGQDWSKAPLGAFRVIGAVMTIAITVTMLMAL
mgnify:CR=1 FL=1